MEIDDDHDWWDDKWWWCFHVCNSFFLEKVSGDHRHPRHVVCLVMYSEMKDKMTGNRQPATGIREKNERDFSRGKFPPTRRTTAFCNPKYNWRPTSSLPLL